MRWSSHKFRAVVRPRLNGNYGDFKALARIIGEPYKSVHRWVRLGQAPRREKWEKIADALGVTVEALTVEGR